MDMDAFAAAVRPLAGGSVPRPAATASGETSAHELLKKRLASELDALRGLLRKAELIPRRGTACKKEERFLASKQRSESETMVDGGSNTTPSAKRKKISSLVEQRQREKQIQERNQLAAAGRLSIHHYYRSPEDKDVKLDVAEESKSTGILMVKEEEDGHVCVVSTIVQQTDSRPSSRISRSSSSGSDECAGRPAPRELRLPEQIKAASGMAQSGGGEEKKVAQRAAPKTVSLPALIYRAKVCRQLMEMERTVLPDETVHRPDLQRLCIAEYGSPSVMWQLGLFLKADA